MLKIGIIGCGKIADQHIAAIRRIPGTEVVAACDREVLMARQLAERFKLPGVYGSSQEMLQKAKPHVVHITTPPQSHASLALECLQSGSHVYVEKPFTVTASEAKDVCHTAESLGLKVAAGHNLQFTLEMLEMRRLVGENFLGGKPVHMESHFAYDLGDTSYVGPLLGDSNHWVRRLPGQLFHNIVSHGIARLSEFLDSQLEVVHATAHQSPKLRKMGGHAILDELRVMIRDRSGTTAYFTFSTQIKPGMNQFRVCGPANSVLVDFIAGTCIRQQNQSCKSYLTYMVPPLRQAKEQARGAFRNFARILRKELHQDSGMKEIIHRFYDAIRSQAPSPTPIREVLLTAELMDTIFAQVYPTVNAPEELTLC